MKRSAPQMALLLCLFGEQNMQAQHSHLNAGALGKNQGDPLVFANGSNFVATLGYVNTLTFTNGGTYAGYYQGGLTLTALPTTALNGGPDPAAAAPGSYVEFSVACLEGPAGGSFAFWEAGATTPSLALVPGETSTNLWPLSESDGSPGSDPYGHIHGRRWTATGPGLYKVGFTLYDTSTNGVSGGPIHQPSQQLAMWFEAGVNVWFIEPDDEDPEDPHTHIHFAAPAGHSWQVEVATTLGPTATWSKVGDPFPGDDLLHLIEDHSPLGLQRYYRLSGSSP